jgi:adenylylsulfate kinase
MASTYERSLVKGIIWEGFSFIITFIAVYIFYGDVGQSLKFTLGLTLVKVILFFIHERIWKEIRWGKYSLKDKAYL